MFKPLVMSVAVILAVGGSVMLETGTGAPPTGTVQRVAVAEADADEHEVGVDDTSEVPVVSLRPDVTVIGASQTERAAVDEALERFRAAGLALPDLEIEFYDDQTACKGHEGLFVIRHTPWRVLVCSELAFVLTHELAHAWEASNLDDADRERYLARRGLSTWNDHDATWSERGVEEAAFMLQQNLMAGSVDPESTRWVERTAAYEALTGRPSPLLSGP